MNALPAEYFNESCYSSGFLYCLFISIWRDFFAENREYIFLILNIKSKNMKRLSSLLLVVLGLYAVSSCNHATSTSGSNADSTKIANDSLMAAQKLTSSDTAFMMGAAQDGMVEVGLGKIAAKMTHNKRVKDFALMMVRDHTRIGDSLKALAGRDNIMLPDSCTKAQYAMRDELEKKRGVAFDKAYMNTMVAGHEHAVDVFKTEAAEVKNPALKSFTDSSLTVIEMHLDSAQAINSSIK
jgi:putative membrane protein